MSMPSLDCPLNMLLFVNRKFWNFGAVMVLAPTHPLYMLPECIDDFVPFFATSTFISGFNQ